MESKLRRTVDIEIFGEEHQLKFTISAIEMFEANTDEKNITYSATKPIWSMKDVIAGLHAALRWQMPKLTREQVKEALPALLRKQSMLDLQSLLVSAIGLSGLVFGDDGRSPFAEILAAPGSDDETEEETEKK